MKNKKLKNAVKYVAFLFFYFFICIIFSLNIAASNESVIDPNAYFLHGCYFYFNKNYEKAKINFEKFLELKPASDYTKLRLAQTLIYQKKNDEAFKLLLPLSEKETIYACEADIILASISLENKKEMTAISFLNHALSLNPKNKNLFIALSKLYEDLHLLSDAVKTNIKAAEAFPDEVYFFYKTAELYFLSNDYEKSLSYYEQAFSKKDNDLKIILGLALCYKNLKQFEKALNFFEKALKIDPINQNIYEEIIKVKSNLQKWDEAFLSCENLISINPKSLKAFSLYGYLCISSKNVDRGIKFFEQHKENFNQAGEFWFWMARFYEDDKDQTKSSVYYEKAINLSDIKEKARFYYALFLHKINKIEEAIVQLQELIKETPQHAKALNFLGYLYIETNRPLNDALAFIEKALKLEPDNPAFLDSMGWVLFKKRNYKEALIYQERARALDPSQIILKHLYEIYMALGETQKAISLSTLIKGFNPE